MDRLTPEQLAKRLCEGTEGVDVAQIYTHKKSGAEYITLTTCLREHDLEPCVVYAPVGAEELGYSLSFCRPASEFLEKFG